MASSQTTQLARPWIAVEGGSIEVVSTKSAGGVTLIFCESLTKKLAARREAPIFLGPDVIAAIVKAAGVS